MTHRRIRTWALAASAVGLLGASSGTALAADSPDVTTKATFAKQDVNIKRLTAGAQMTKDEKGPARAFAGPTFMLADPNNPRVIVAATADLRTRVCHLVRSTDAGRTWHVLFLSLPTTDAYPLCTNGSAGVSQDAIAWGRNSTLYFAHEGYAPDEGGTGMGAGRGNASIVVARSTDLGDTWHVTVADNNRGKTGVAPADSGVTGLAVDASGPRDVVYVGFTQDFKDAPKNSPLQDGAVAVAVSTDGGTTFAPPVNLNTFATNLTQTVAGKSYPIQMTGGFGAPFLMVHKGVVEAVAGAGTPYNAKLPKSSFAYPLPLLVARSTDQGKTWSMQKLSPPIYNGTGVQTGLGWTPKGGPQGTIIAVHSATPATAASSGTANIVVQRSTDLGQTWTDPVVLNDDDPSKQFTSFYPQVGVAPNGRVDVVWEDNRNQADYHIQVRYTYSTDGGKTWAHNVAVNDRPIDFSYGVSYNSDIRQPPGVASANEYAAFGWADTRKADQTTQTQDNYSTMAQFAPIPAQGSTVLPILAAVFGGLAAAGVVLVTVLLLRRRRERPNPPTKVDRLEPVS